MLTDFRAICGHRKEKKNVSEPKQYTRAGEYLYRDAIYNNYVVNIFFYNLRAGTTESRSRLFSSRPSIHTRVDT